MLEMGREYRSERDCTRSLRVLSLTLPLYLPIQDDRLHSSRHDPDAGRRPSVCARRRAQLKHRRADVRRVRLSSLQYPPPHPESQTLTLTPPSFKSYNSASGQTSIQREWDTYNPITDPMITIMGCNDNGSSLGVGQLKTSVPARLNVVAF